MHGLAEARRLPVSYQVLDRLQSGSLRRESVMKIEGIFFHGKEAITTKNHRNLTIGYWVSRHG